jgi:two-component system chemotaxis response regulator CheB
MSYELVVIGTSWGGLEASGRILGALPSGFGCAIVVLQHRSSEESQLVTLLRRRTTLPVREAYDKDPLVAGTVLVAPPNYHLLIERGSVALSTDAPVAHSRPSIDVLFESAADSYEDRVIGVVLTGANEDGAAGLARIKARGGYTIVEDPETAERATMPRAALARVTPDAVLSIDAIAARVTDLCRVGDPDRLEDAR